MLSKLLKILTLFFLIPVVSSAQVVITEIMYDLEAGDSGREWVEITNTSSDPVDLANWKFFENGSNHGLVVYQGSANLEALKSAIIADDPVKFITDNPGFSGSIFDSSFSLSNSGETLTIRNGELMDIDSVNYSSDWGANGDGNSIQFSNGTWVSSTPTPGTYSSSSSSSEESGSSESSNNPSSPASPTIDFPVGAIKTNIVAEKVVFSGADVFFEAESFGTDNKPLENANHLWNFGDGSIKKGEKVLHGYVYPGEYVVYLDVSSANYSTAKKFYISVIPSDLIISNYGADFIKVENNSKSEINISLWILQAGGQFFTLPMNTYIKAEGQISFYSGFTGLDGNLRPLKLLYPNGKTAYEFGEVEMATIPDIPRVMNTVLQVSEPKDIEQKTKTGNLASAIFTQEVLAEEVKNSDEDGNFFNDYFLIVVGLAVLSILVVIFVKNKPKVEGYEIVE